MKSQCVQRVITNVGDVPAGYVPLKNYGSRTNNQSGSPEYELLHAAYRGERINAVKLMRTPRDHSGLVFVDEQQATELLAGAQQKAATPPQQAVNNTDGGLLEHIVDMRISQARCVAYLGDIYDVMETIARATEATAKAAEATAKAVEEMATRPTPASLKPTSTANGNGFHS